MNNYEKEVEQRWGKTAAYKEHTEKTANYTKEKWEEINNGLNTIFIKFARCKKCGHIASSQETQAVVTELQNYITKYYYTCTNEILAGLGQMYIGDERFKENIDKNGADTAEFVSEAIKFYCKN